MDDNYYARLKEVMEAKHLSVYRVAKATGVDKATFTRWANGTSKPKAETLQKVCDYLDVSMSLILNGFEDDAENYIRHPKIPVFKCCPITGQTTALYYIEVDQTFALNHFGVIAKDDSMSPYILKKDILIVHETPTVADGKIAFVREGTEDMCGHLYNTKDGVLISPINSLYSPKMCTGTVVIGEVVEIRRRV